MFETGIEKVHRGRGSVTSCSSLPPTRVFTTVGIYKVRALIVALYFLAGKARMLNIGTVRVKQEGLILFSERDTNLMCTQERYAKPASYAWDGFLVINVPALFRNTQYTQIASTASKTRRSINWNEHGSEVGIFAFWKGKFGIRFYSRGSFVLTENLRGLLEIFQK